MLRVERDAVEGRGFQSVPPPRERRDSEPEMMLGQVMPRHGATVLVVEDEALVRKAVQHYLVNAGYRVVTACDERKRSNTGMPTGARSIWC